MSKIHNREITYYCILWLSEYNSFNKSHAICIQNVTFTLCEIQVSNRLPQHKPWHQLQMLEHMAREVQLAAMTIILKLMALPLLLYTKYTQAKHIFNHTAFRTKSSMLEFRQTNSAACWTAWIICQYMHRIECAGVLWQRVIISKKL